MLEYKGIKYSLNDTPDYTNKRQSGRLFSYELKPKKANVL